MYVCHALKNCKQLSYYAMVTLMQLVGVSVFDMQAVRSWNIPNYFEMLSGI